MFLFRGSGLSGIPHPVVSLPPLFSLFPFISPLISKLAFPFWFLGLIATPIILPFPPPPPQKTSSFLQLSAKSAAVAAVGSETKTKHAPNSFSTHIHYAYQITNFPNMSYMTDMQCTPPPGFKMKINFSSTLFILNHVLYAAGSMQSTRFTACRYCQSITRNFLLQKLERYFHFLHHSFTSFTPPLLIEVDGLQTSSPPLEN